MNTWKVILATLVIFGTGVITGGLLVSYSDRASHRLAGRLPVADPPLWGPGRQRVPLEMDPGLSRENRVPLAFGIPLRKDFLDRLNRELKLSPEQHERIERIVSEGQDRTRELWRVEWVATKQRIRAELTQEQQTRFETLFKLRPRDQRRPPPPPDRLSTNPIESATPADLRASP